MVITKSSSAAGCTRRWPGITCLCCQADIYYVLQLVMTLKLSTVKLVFRKFYHCAIRTKIQIKFDPNLKILLCQLYNLSEKENYENEKLRNCKYRDISYFSNLDVELKSKFLSFFHLNINSLSKGFDNFNHLINELKLEFDILGC